MFETLEGALEMIWLYAAAGFCLAVIYNVLRFFRLAFPKMKKAAAVSDLLFAVLAGFVLFALSVEYGMGFFRLYYVVAAAFGFALNMVTLGAVVPPLSRLFGKICVWTGGKIAAPVRFLCEKATYLCTGLLDKTSKFAEKSKKYLKNHRRVLYNIEDNKIDEVYPEGGEHRNAVKAKIRKIG